MLWGRRESRKVRGSSAMAKGERDTRLDDPAFWRAGAVSTIAVMSVVLIMLTIDTLAAISPGGSHVPPYTVINQHIDYKFDGNRGFDVPVIGGGPNHCSANRWMNLPRQP